MSEPNILHQIGDSGWMKIFAAFMNQQGVSEVRLDAGDFKGMGPKTHTMVIQEDQGCLVINMVPEDEVSAIVEAYKRRCADG